MKNKIVFIGSLCAILALGLVFAGCEEAQLVKLETSKLSAPGNVNATIVSIGSGTSSYTAVEITWDAVDGAGVSYSIFYTQEGKKTVREFSSYYDGSPISDSTTDTIPDLDKWRIRIPTSSFYKGTWKFGVRASQSSNIIGSEPSDIAWASTPVIIQ
jgi:hypothetical protein